MEGLKKYIDAYHPKEYVFNGKSSGSALSARGVQWAMKQTVKQAGITKEVTVHSLNTLFVTHLLEYAMDIDTLSF